MENPEKGFVIGERFVPWGTTLEEACRLLGAPAGQGGYSPHDIQLPCASVYGFPAVSACLTAPAANRPIISAAFELAPAIGAPPMPDPEYWMPQLLERLGPPARVNRSEIPSYADPAGCVPFYAGWDLADTGVGLSVYGGLRQADGGESAGTLWLSWSEQRAAQPYLEEWRARVARLATMAEQTSQLQRFVLDLPQHAYGLAPPFTPQALAARQARICLYQPALLDTPAPIASQLKSNSFALWSSGMHGIWCASTRHDSVTFKLGQPVQVAWIELQPAKGPGYSGLEIEGWTVYAGPGSRAVREAAQMLGRFSGVSVKQQGGYDC
jgi:hypothetical protein